MENYIGILQTLGFAIESGRDGIKILRNHSDLKSMEKALIMLEEQFEKRLKTLNIFVNDLNLEDENEKVKLVNSFRENMSLERELNALTICMSGIKKVDVNKIKDEGISKDFFNTYFERSKDITSDELRATWSELLKIEIENPGMVSLKVMNTVESLDKDTIKNFNNVAQYLFNDFIINSKDEDLRIYRTSHMQLIDFQDSGLIMQTQTKYTPRKNIRGFYSYDIRPGNDLIISAVFQNEQSFVGYNLTRVGKAIKKIIKPSTDEEYQDRLTQYFKSKGAFLISYSDHENGIFKTLYASKDIDSILPK